MIAYLVGRGANLEERDDYGKTALLMASAVHGVEAVSLLLEAGADVEAMDHGGYSSLLLAVLLKRAAVAPAGPWGSRSGGGLGRRRADRALHRGTVLTRKAQDTGGLRQGRGQPQDSDSFR